MPLQLARHMTACGLAAALSIGCVSTAEPEVASPDVAAPDLAAPDLTSMAAEASAFTVDAAFGTRYSVTLDTVELFLDERGREKAAEPGRYQRSRHLAAWGSSLLQGRRMSVWRDPDPKAAHQKRSVKRSVSGRVASSALR